MMLMVLTYVNRNFAHMMGESSTPVESFVLPSELKGAEPIVCKTLEDSAPFCMIEYR